MRTSHCIFRQFIFFICVSTVLAIFNTSRAELNIGITLHPYFSYVKNIVKDRATITPLIEAGFNPHSYKLSPADIARLKEMDAIVVNGIGHDEFAMEALRSLDMQNLNVILANENVPLLTKPGGKVHNPHTFVAIDAAIRQVYTIARKLAEMDPENGAFFKRNAIDYAKQLREIKKAAMGKIANLNLSQIRIASTHNAYGYLLQEFGMTVAAVVEPAHGVSPSAAQLQDTIDKIRDANVQILFTELNMQNQYVKVVERETNSRLYHFSHMTYGEYRENLVIEEMKHNLKTLVSALSYAAEKI
ncbi:MAG: zinc ABC transporter substrate-binding protein [Pseudomonadota bacterium]